MSSISPFSKNPEARKDAGLPVPPFVFEGGPPERREPPSPSSPSFILPEAHEPLAEACLLASGPATPAHLERVRALLGAAPGIGMAARLWKDERASPIQAFPALACAAIQGDDPEGWTQPLLAWGASFDVREARSQARAEMMAMPSQRASRLPWLNARCDALSLWTLACAEASHPHSALRAIEAARHLAPQAMAPLSSELAHYANPSEFDKPSIPTPSRAGAFVEAARADPAFCEAILPTWARGPRGGDLAPIARPIADALSLIEALRLSAALSLDEPPSEGVLALRSALRLTLSARSKAREKV